MKKYKTSETSHNVLSEPLTSYQSANYFSIASGRISKDYIKKVLTLTKLSLTEFITIVPISIDTYKRKSAFDSQVTEKVLQIEEVYRKGLGAFGAGFHNWMNAENVAMGGIVPKILLSNSFGIRCLLDQIGRMEHGVLA